MIWILTDVFNLCGCVTCTLAFVHFVSASLYCFSVWSLRTTHSCKRSALVSTTFSNSRGGRLRELWLYKIKWCDIIKILKEEDGKPCFMICKLWEIVMYNSKFLRPLTNWGEILKSIWGKNSHRPCWPLMKLCFSSLARRKVCSVKHLCC